MITMAFLAGIIIGSYIGFGLGLCAKDLIDQLVNWTFDNND